MRIDSSVLEDGETEQLPKRYTVGTHRVFAPAETLARMQPHMKRMGITRLANVTGLDRVGVSVVMAVRPNSRSVAVSQGKGVDLDAAKASALMETVETWHAENIRQAWRYDCYQSLSQSKRALHPKDLPANGNNPNHENDLCLGL